MIKLVRLAEISPEQYDSVSALWEVTGVGNPKRGDTFDAVCHNLSNGGRIIIALWDDLPVGTVWLTHDFRRLYIHHMAVHPDYRNKGIGRQMLQESLACAKEMNLQAKLEVHKDNPAACHLYESCGFATLDGYKTMIKRDI